jgi:molybdopterin/thiamine biosynthesis adenylyltransferase
LSASDKQTTRSEACITRLSSLNRYVSTKVAPCLPMPLTAEELEKPEWALNEYHVVILTEASYETMVAVNAYCHKKGIKFICTDAFGVFGRVFNDFTGEFEVLDKNGEELPDLAIKSISSEEKGVVELIESVKHKFEDGDECTFSLVNGMKLKEGQKHEDQGIKSDCINDSIHKVTVVTPYKIKIGDTTKF